MGQEKLSKNRTDNEENRFVSNSDDKVAVSTVTEIDTSGTGPVETNPMSGSLLQGVVFDSIDTSFPSATVEVYRYYDGGLAGTLTATVTVTYTNSNKKFLSSAVRT